MIRVLWAIGLWFGVEILFLAALLGQAAWEEATEAARSAAHKTTASEPEPELAGASSHRDPGLHEWRHGGRSRRDRRRETIVLTRQAMVDLPAAGILAASLLFVWRFKNREPLLVLLDEAAGMLMKGL